MSDLLQWDLDGQRIYETGISNGILFRKKTSVADTDNTAYEAGEVWNGLTSVDESPSGGENNDIYADNMKYLSLSSAEDYGGTINAYTYPDGFKECNGELTTSNGVTVGQQTRKPFGFYYKTKKGNDLLYEDFGEIHYLVYNAKCNPSDKSHSTISDSPEAEEMSWEFTTTPVKFKSVKKADGSDYKATAIIKIDTTEFDTEHAYAGTLTADETVNPAKTYYTRTGTEGSYVYTKVAEPTDSGLSTYYEATDTDQIRWDSLRQILYGTKASLGGTDTPARLPDPDEVIKRMNGTWSNS